MAGHLLPMDLPAAALDMITRWDGPASKGARGQGGRVIIRSLNSATLFPAFIIAIWQPASKQPTVATLSRL